MHPYCVVSYVPCVLVRDGRGQLDAYSTKGAMVVV